MPTTDELGFEVNEVWRDIPEFIGMYQVSDKGRVKSLARIQKRRGRNYIISERILKVHTNKKGYIIVGLHKNKKMYSKTVHVLVLSSFVGKRPKGLQACHKDDIKSNNFLSNLRWDTPKNNALDRIKNGNQVKGEQVKQSKLTENQIKSIRFEFNSGKYTRDMLATKYNISKTNIQDILKGKIWKHIKGPICLAQSGKGEEHGNSKLSDEQIREIRYLRNQKGTLKEIGDKFNVHLSLISLICSNKIWKHI